jgi:hypothetical protein
LISKTRTDRFETKSRIQSSMMNLIIWFGLNRFRWQTRICTRFWSSSFARSCSVTWLCPAAMVARLINLHPLRLQLV